MRNARLFTVLIVVLAVGIGVAGPAETPESPGEVPEPAPTPVVPPLYRNSDRSPVAAPQIRVLPLLAADERDLVAAARRRFSLVGLDLPDVEISFHDDTEPCEGNDGIFHGDGGDRRVLVCVADRGTAYSELQRRRTLHHELAHAWEHANLDDDDREALLEVVDAESWYSADLAWDQRGAERFAEIIVWGLYDQIRRPTFVDASCPDLHAAFRAITGHTAPGPLREMCALEPEPAPCAPSYERRGSVDLARGSSRPNASAARLSARSMNWA